MKGIDHWESFQVAAQRKKERNQRKYVACLKPFAKEECAQREREKKRKSFKKQPKLRRIR
jgi:hypothetical protein